MGSEAQYLAVLGLSTAAAISLYLLVPYIPGLSGSGSQTRGPVVPGLRNWANWCFCNSVLQSLAALSAWEEYLDAQTSHLSSPDKLAKPAGILSEESSGGTGDDAASGEMQDDMTLVQTMRETMKMLNVEGLHRVLSSSVLVSALESAQKTRISRAQQDAQEFLHILLESVAAEINQLPSTVSLQQMSSQAAREGRTYRALPFEGSITTTSTCMSCRHNLKAQTSPFLELTLLPPTTNRMSLSDCIAQTMADELIDDYHCIHCQITQLKRAGKQTRQFEDALARDVDYELPAEAGRSHVTLRRTAVLSSLPAILVLHVNRSLFGAYATRNAIDVTYDEVLTMNDGKTHYALRSLVIHKGSHERGHYIAYRKKGGRWFAISDETVRVVNGDTALGMGAATFLMFYEKVAEEAVEQRDGRTQLRNRKKQKRKRAKRRQQSGTEMDEMKSKM